MDEEKIELQIDLLKHDLEVFDKANSHLKRTYQKASKLDFYSVLDHDELELMDSLASRFMRSYEVLKNQVLRTMLILHREKAETLIDRMHSSEKLFLITSAKDLDDIRTTRNKVAHEYLDLNKEWMPIYQDLMRQTPILLKCEQMVKEVVLKKGYLNNEE